MNQKIDPEDPKLLAVHAKRLIHRDIDQLLGVCEFALQDGHIDQDEAKGILLWLDNHRASLDTWPASVLYDRLRQMLADGHLDEDEQGELLGLVMAIARPPSRNQERTPSALPIDHPLPDIIFTNRTFCFTGVFDFGSRAECHEAVATKQGIAAKGITKKLNYLVIGNIGSELWKHSSFGLKISKAIGYRDDGLPLSIVDENHWEKFLRS